MNKFVERAGKNMDMRCGVARDARIGVALSGGADSVALLLAMRGCGYACLAMHCNFSLRGDESDGDETFCRELCARHGIGIKVVRFDTMASRLPGESVEMACRRLRYDWFEAAISVGEVDAVALAHHEEDAQETAFINLLRGTGPAGLRGMRWRRGNFVRPLLDARRDDIEAYLAEVGEGFRIDSSNLANDYRRNALRNVVLPRVREFFPDMDSGMSATFAAMTAADESLSDYASMLYAAAVVAAGGSWSVDLSLLPADVDAASRALYLLSRHPGVNVPISKVTADSIARASLSAESKTFMSVDGRKLELFQGRLFPMTEALLAEGGRRVVQGDVVEYETIGRDDFEAMDKASLGRDAVCFDADEVGPVESLTLRHWRAGDRIMPFGMKGSRKLSDLFSDLHLSSSAKKSVWLLCRGEEVLWVVGLRASRLCPVAGDTKNVLYLKKM